MKTCLCAALALAGALAVSAADEPKAARADKASAGSYAHVVIFRLSKDAPGGTADELIADCHNMLAKVASVRSLKVGRPSEQGTPDLAKKDYDVGMVLFFDDAAGLKAYLEDPLHLKFVEKHGKHIDRDKLEVFDFQDVKK
jgi:hypothetical protein